MIITCVRQPLAISSSSTWKNSRTRAGSSPSEPPRTTVSSHASTLYHCRYCSVTYTVDHFRVIPLGCGSGGGGAAASSVPASALPIASSRAYSTYSPSALYSRCSSTPASLMLAASRSPVSSGGPGPLTATSAQCARSHESEMSTETATGAKSSRKRKWRITNSRSWPHGTRARHGRVWFAAPTKVYGCLQSGHGTRMSRDGLRTRWLTQKSFTHAACTHFEVPTHLHGAIMSVPAVEVSSTRQIQQRNSSFSACAWAAEPMTSGTARRRRREVRRG